MILHSFILGGPDKHWNFSIIPKDGMIFPDFPTRNFGNLGISDILEKFQCTPLQNFNQNFFLILWHLSESIDVPV